MKRTFCTLFDHNYLFKGLSLYNSLLEHCPDFALWILAMSDETYVLLKKLDLKHVRIIKLDDFEDPELKKVKVTRSPVEYCWTLTPSLPLYILSHDKTIDMVSYVDADCFFFSDPKPLYDELGQDSVLIIEHRYSADRKAWEKTSGRFNVELLIFRRDEIGLKVLSKWRNQCIEWCYFRQEDGKLGDQMYLNSWPEKYDKIHILQYKGGGLAPWNIKNYILSREKSKIFVDEDLLVFYHFHALKLYSLRLFELSAGYEFTAREKEIIYAPYLLALKKAAAEIMAIDKNFQHGFTPKSTIATRIINKASRAKKLVWKTK